jgi:hypothetical protein
MFTRLSLFYLTIIFILNGCISFSKYWYNYNIIENFNYTLDIYDHKKFNKLLFDIHSIGHINWGIVIGALFNYNFSYSNMLHIIWEIFENCPISVSYYNQGLLNYPDTFVNTISDQIFFIIGFYISKKINNKRLSYVIYFIIEISWLIINSITTPLECFINFWTIINISYILIIVYNGYIKNNKIIKFKNYLL